MTICQNPVALIDRGYIWQLRMQVMLSQLSGKLVNFFAAAKGAESSSSTVSIDDLRDIELSLKGDSHAYRRIIERYQQHVGGILWKFSRNAGTHEELVQDVFVEAYLSLRTYKAKAPLSHWFARIAARVGYHYWKHNEHKRETEHFSFEEWDRLAEKEKVEEVDPSEAAQLLHKLLAQLPARDRLVLTLRYMEGCSVEETAERTGWSRSMVKVQSWRAKGKLKKLFLREGRELKL